MGMVMLAVILVGFFPKTAFAKPEKQVLTHFITPGREYLICSANPVTDKDRVEMAHCVLKGGFAKDPHGLAYGPKPESALPSADCLWVFEAAEGADLYYMKSVATGRYLNLTSAGPNDRKGHGRASTEKEKQALKVYFSEGGYKISANVEGEVYWVRFANIYEVSLWEAGSADNNNVFHLYAAGRGDGEYAEAGDSLFSVAAFADPHVDYGIQSWQTPIRQSTIDAAEYIRDLLGPVDVALVAGDMVSNNGKNTWTKALFDKVQITMFSTLAKATKEGNVLFVAGNHDNEAGINADDSWYSGDWGDIMTAQNGEFTAEYRFDDRGKGKSKFNELLCYRYTLNGMEFIGINTPYRAERSNGYIYVDQIEWVRKQLKEIGREKTVLLLCHYPLGYLGTAPGDSRGEVEEKLKSLLQVYPNAIWVYGHHHGSDAEYAWYNTYELVRPAGNVEKLPNNAFRSSSYITAHAGSMGYYNTRFQWHLSELEPGINQFLRMDFYTDHITFRYYNTGAGSADDDVRFLSSFTVMRDLSSQLGGEGWTDRPSASTDRDTSSSTDDSEGSQALSSSTQGEREGSFPGWGWAVVGSASVLLLAAAVLWLFLRKKK